MIWKKYKYKDYAKDYRIIIDCTNIKIVLEFN